MYLAAFARESYRGKARASVAPYASIIRDPFNATLVHTTHYMISD